jgi:hypothetical protein
VAAVGVQYQGAGAATAAPKLAHLLAGWGLEPPAAPPQPVVERLSGWLGWTDAITLAQTLNTPATPGSEALAATRDWADAALERLRSELRASFADRVLVGEVEAPTALAFADAFAPYRLHHAQQQRALAARVGTLRERLRAKLAGAPSPRLVRLAQLDVVFERALAERQALAAGALPAVLHQRAQRLHALDPSGWCARIWADLQTLLDAELELQLQPVLGLVEALREGD